MKSPYPYMGGKSSIAELVWSYFGDVHNLVDPFFGSNAILLSRPSDHTNTKETVNDIDGMISNFWRAVKSDPEKVSHYADYPILENDLHARHSWLVQQKEGLVARLEGNPDYSDAKIAGWWVWGMCIWIGKGFCSGKGPWQVVAGELVKGNSGQGINRQRPHMGGGGTGQGVTAKVDIYAYMQALSDRLRRARVACGDWSRVCGPSVTYKHGMTAVFLDPPYAKEAKRKMGIYNHDSDTIAHDVREWCFEIIEDKPRKYKGPRHLHPKMRIALCGYWDEHGPHMTNDWELVEWSTGGGYGNQRKGSKNDNRHKECVWFSKHCLRPEKQGQMALL